MNILPIEKRAQILQLLVEGNSMHLTSRVANVSINTVMKLLGNVGAACREFHNATVHNIKSKCVQCDEIWSFGYAKEKNVALEVKGGLGCGAVHTWTAIDSVTKLVVSWLVGRRDAECAEAFISDLASRFEERIQLIEDGHGVYVGAVEKIFGGVLDYAMLVKVLEGVGVMDDQRSLCHLANGFGKKIENLANAVALHFFFYNFGCIHRTLRVTPAMEANIADHVWTLEEIAGLVKFETPKKRGL